MWVDIKDFRDSMYSSIEDVNHVGKMVMSSSLKNMQFKGRAVQLHVTTPMRPASVKYTVV